jgi:hypothetical protein
VAGWFGYRSAIDLDIGLNTAVKRWRLEDKVRNWGKVKKKEQGRTEDDARNIYTPLFTFRRSRANQRTHKDLLFVVLVKLTLSIPATSSRGGRRRRVRVLPRLDGHGEGSNGGVSGRGGCRARGGESKRRSAVGWGRVCISDDGCEREGETYRLKWWLSWTFCVLAFEDLERQNTRGRWLGGVP